MFNLWRKLMPEPEPESESLEETLDSVGGHPLTGDGSGRVIKAEAHGHMEIKEALGSDPPPGDDVETLQPGNKVGVTTAALLGEAVRDFAAACRGCNTRLKVGGGFNATLFNAFAEQWAKRLSNDDDTLSREPRA